MKQEYFIKQFKETLQAKVDCYNTLTNPNGTKRTDEQRLRLFKIDLYSCTGIAYKAYTTKFKIVPVCPELIMIDPAYNKYKSCLFVDYDFVDYDKIQGFEFDSSNGKY